MPGREGDTHTLTRAGEARRVHGDSPASVCERPVPGAQAQQRLMVRRALRMVMCYGFSGQLILKFLVQNYIKLKSNSFMVRLLDYLDYI